MARQRVGTSDSEKLMSITDISEEGTVTLCVDSRLIGEIQGELESGGNARAEAVGDETLIVFMTEKGLGRFDNAAALVRYVRDIWLSQVCIRYVVKGSAVRDPRADAAASFGWSWNEIQQDVYETAQDKGWWDAPREDGTMIALMHSELSEALEALRHGNPADDKIPVYDGCTAELADVVIRIMDFCGHHGMPVADAIVDKIAFNKTRPHKHGGKEF